MLPEEQADVPARPIHHMQKSADTASTHRVSNTLQQREGSQRNADHACAIMSPHDRHVNYQRAGEGKHAQCIHT